jgi:hypothetical protein
MTSLKLLLPLFFPLLLSAQRVEWERHDTLQVEGRASPFYALKIDNYSLSEPVMVLVVLARSFDSVQRRLRALYFSFKQEYTEFYVPGAKGEKGEEEALMVLLQAIDSSRARRNKTTLLQPCRWDAGEGRFHYGSGQKALTEISNLYYLHRAEEVCRYLVCRRQC